MEEGHDVDPDPVGPGNNNKGRRTSETDAGRRMRNEG
jgi:hypothetical protein